MANYLYIWCRGLKNGIYQFYAYKKDGETVVETARDIRDGLKCRELWGVLKSENPDIDNFPNFCACYRDAKEEFQKYSKRNQRRYNKFWGAKA